MAAFEIDSWKQARQQIADYEKHLLDKQLAVKEDEAALDAEMEFAQGLRAEMSSEAKRAKDLEAQINQHRVDLLGLYKAKKSAESQIQHLQEQRLLIAKETSLLMQQAEVERAAFNEHVTAESEHITTVINHYKQQSQETDMETTS